jgi:hypothetical protein
MKEAVEGGNMVGHKPDGWYEEESSKRTQYFFVFFPVFSSWEMALEGIIRMLSLLLWSCVAFSSDFCRRVLEHMEVVGKGKEEGEGL